MNVSVSILYLPGTNCQAETEGAFKRVGANVRLLFLSDVLAGKARLDDSAILCIPGGFSFGDHLGAGRVAATLLSTQLRDQFRACMAKPMLCICNGFQIAIRAGCFGDGATLAVNDCGTFVDEPQQEHIVSPAADTPWLEGLSGLRLRFPCAHGEGRFVYRCADGWRAAFLYPDGHNPDGSQDNIAGISTGDGMVLGIMNHPERALRRAENLAIFENGVRLAS